MSALGKDSMSVYHHSKDLFARLIFGSGIGWLLSNTIVAKPFEKKYDKVAEEEMEDKETLLYAVKKMEKNNTYPGRIRDKTLSKRF